MSIKARSKKGIGKTCSYCQKVHFETLRPDPKYSQRIDHPHPFDVPRSKCPWGAFPPLGRRDLLLPIFGDVNDFHCSRHVRLVGSGHRLFALLPLTPTAIRLPAVISHQLKGLFRDVLGDGGNEFHGGKMYLFSQ